MRRLLPISCVLLAACDFPHGSLGPRDGTITTDDDGDIDAPMIDAMVDAPDDKCYARGAFYTCLQDAPIGTITLQGDIDTTLCTAETTGDMVTGTAMTMTDGTRVCVITAATITMGMTVGVFGTKPLVLIASGNITVPTGVTLDGSSAAFPTIGVAGDGPNANPSDCGNRPSGGANAGGGGGGAGGTFGTKGGDGGNGGGATGGVAPAVPTPFNKLRGGCPGGDGGTGGSGSSTAPGGSGGGAIAMFARGTIQIDGTVTVNGAGGGGGNDSKGGAGGGGSGGMVVLHATTINLGGASRVMANGGGGGAGAGVATDGGNGQDSTLMDTVASGGVGGGAAGGAGAANSTGAVTPASSANGGPGAGGGVGVIRVLSGQSLSTARTSPDAIVN